MEIYVEENRGRFVNKSSCLAKYGEIMQILSFKTKLKTFNSICHFETRKYNLFGARLFLKSNQIKKMWKMSNQNRQFVQPREDTL